MYCPKPVSICLTVRRPISRIFRGIGTYNKFGKRKISSIWIREYNSSKQNFKQEFERRKYDQLIREQVLRSTLQNNMGFINGSSTVRDNRKLPFRTILLLIICSSSLTIGVYVISQLVKFKQDGNHRRIFLPLWFSANWLFKSTYSFPKGLKYLDREYFDYSMVEMSQQNSGNDCSDVGNFIKLLIDENIKYKVLEELSLNNSIRKMFKLPLGIDLDSPKFNIWLETKYPSVSGIQINMENNNGVSSVNMSWIIKLLNFNSIINDALVLAGLKLDRISTDESIRGSFLDKGIKEAKSINEHKHINTNKDYDVFFSGEFKIKDKYKVEKGTLSYKGMFDFSHLMINRGVKIIKMNMVLETNESESIKYKVL